MFDTVQITRYGGPEVLIKSKKDSARLRANDIRIQVDASGVNFADILMRMGLYPEAPKPPFTPGYEVAGTVIEVGQNVTEFKIGDQVVSATSFGGYSTEVVVPAYLALKKPESLSSEEAAAIPVNFVTAWLALQEMARVRIGDRVLIHSAAGGVGLAAVQVAAQAGAQVIGVVGQEAKVQTVREYGAKEVILKSEWKTKNASELKQRYGEFDIVLDSSGGETLKKGFDCLAALGRVITFGVSNMAPNSKRSYLKVAKFLVNTPFYSPFKLMMNNKGVYGLNVLKLMEKPELLSQVLSQVIVGFEDGKYRVKIGKTFDLKDASKAQAFLQSGNTIGKIVLKS